MSGALMMLLSSARGGGGGGGGGAFITPSVEFADGALPSQTAETLMGSGGDYIICRGNSGSPIRGGVSAFGSAIGILTGPTDTNIDTGSRTEIDDGSSGHCDNITCNVPAGEGGVTGHSLSGYLVSVAGTARKRAFVAPATAGQQNTVRVSFCIRRYEFGDTSTQIGLRLVLTLSDGSTGPVTYDYTGTTGDYGYFGGQIKIDYKPTSSGTLTISCEEAPSMIPFQSTGFPLFGVHSVIYTPNT